MAERLEATVCLVMLKLRNVSIRKGWKNKLCHCELLEKTILWDIIEWITETIGNYRPCCVLYNLDNAAVATKFASALLDESRAYFL